MFACCLVGRLLNKQLSPIRSVWRDVNQLEVYTLQLQLTKATMAEYWKSTVSNHVLSAAAAAPIKRPLTNTRFIFQPNYWCKHCKTYIRDTPFARNQHEATGKHQGSLKRFLRDIHRSKEQEERKGQSAKSEVQRLKGLVSSGSEEGAAGSERQQQQKEPPWKRGSGDSGAATASGSNSVAVQDRKKQMAQLIDMGVAIPEQYRAEMALAGEWRAAADQESSKDSETASGEATASATAVGVRKRKYQGNAGGAEDAEEAASRKAWGSAIRRYPGAGGGVDEELEALLGKTSELKDRKVEKKEAVTSNVKHENDEDAAVKADISQASVKHEDTERTSREPSADNTATITKKEPTETTDAVKPEEEEDSTEKALHSIPETTTETSADTPPVVFKKRKPKQMKR